VAWAAGVWVRVRRLTSAAPGTGRGEVSGGISRCRFPLDGGGHRSCLRPPQARRVADSFTQLGVVALRGGKTQSRRERHLRPLIGNRAAGLCEDALVNAAGPRLNRGGSATVAQLFWATLTFGVVRPAARPRFSFREKRGLTTSDSVVNEHSACWVSRS